MNVVVFGSAGLLGTEVVREWRAHGHQVHALTRADVDVTADAAVRALVRRLAPDLVINCTAYNLVDEAESRPLDALRANTFAVRSMARGAADADAGFVHYSTDFVFDGLTDRPYVETDAPNPVSAYGASKLLGEWCAADAPRHWVLRVESLFGGTAARSSVDRMLDAMRAGQQVKAFADRAVSPSHVGDVAVATRMLVERDCPTGLYHCVNSGYTTWLGIAEAIRDDLQLSTADIVGTSAATTVMRAARPMFAALSNEKLAAVGVAMPTWRDALARHIRSRTDGGGVSLA
jgi:dTDP-4-dehydrorhamnose reductase